MNAPPAIPREKLYWTSQFSGWLIYVLLMWILNRLDGQGMNWYFFLNLLTTFLLGIVISHGYRLLIINFNWLRYKIIQLIPRVIITSVLCGAVLFISHSFISEVLIAGDWPTYKGLEILQTTINLAVIFMLWSLLYFLFHFIQNYRKEEIKNLKWQALSTEVELNKLKSQLNPHFIFNSMNSIRALVEEDPSKSKDSITQLSNILRSSLLMNRQKVISLAEEMQLVKDYLALEQTRYEERLDVILEIPEDILDHKIPPMLLQTLVENGIKHGISKLESGGKIEVKAQRNEDFLYLKIENSGSYNADQKSTTGFGLLNSLQRINLLYGEEGSLMIKNTERGTVIAELMIPKDIKSFKIEKTDKNESNYH